MDAHRYDPSLYQCAGYDDRYKNHRKGCKTQRTMRFDRRYGTFFYSVECGTTHNEKDIPENLVRCIPTQGKYR